MPFVAGLKKTAHGAIAGGLSHFPKACAQGGAAAFRRSNRRRAEPSTSPVRQPGPGMRVKTSRPELARVVFFSIVCQSWRAGCWSRGGALERTSPRDERFNSVCGDSRWNTGTSYLQNIEYCRYAYSRFRPVAPRYNQLAKAWNVRKFPWFKKNSFT